MIRLTLRPLFAVLLAVLVAAGIGASPAAAGEMATDMAMAPIAADVACGDCRPCDVGGFGKSRSMPCAAVCAASLGAYLPAEANLPALAVEGALRLPLPKQVAFDGDEPPPGRRPPRPSQES